MSVSPPATQYWAFISYSSRDRKWGSWLHRRLENFPIPEEFRGSEVFDGAVLGKSLRPIFRDRDELSGSADLGAAIGRALQRSHFLVVLCSKNSAQSKWVNQEIEDFRALKGDANILALILDGIPNATTTEGVDSSEECFPPALRYPNEPLAGDMRKTGDGRERGFLKVVAGIAQIDFDRLYRRHERMQQRRRFWIGVGAVAIICVMAGLSAVAWHQSNVAKKERNQAVLQEQLAIEERNRADAARIEANHSTSDLLLANGARSIGGGRWGDAVVQLAAAWKTNPQSEEANLLLPIALRQLEGNSEVFQGHPAPISLMRFAPGDGHLVTASEDGQILVWDGESKVVLHDFQDHLLAVRVAAFAQTEDSSPLLATSGDDRRIHLYQLETGKLLYRDLSHLDAVLGLAFTPDGQRLLSWSVDATLAIHSWENNEAPKVIRTFDHGSVRFAAWLHGGEQILAVHHTGKITRWDAADGTLLDQGECSASESIGEPVVCAVLDPSGQWLAVGTRDQGIRFWDVAEHRLAATLKGQAAALWDVQFITMPEPLLPGESLLYLQAVYANGTIERWQPHREMQVPGFYSGAALDGARLPSAADICIHGAFQAIGDSGGGLRMVHAPSGLVLNSADAYEGSCTSMAFAPDGLALWTGGSDGKIRRWQIQGRSILADESGVQCADLHEASNRLLSGGNDGAANLWDLASGELLGQFRHAGHGTLVTAAKFSADGEHLLTAGGREVRLWDANRPEEPLQTIQIEEPHWIRDAAFCQEERAAVVAVRTYLDVEGSAPTTSSEGDGWRIFDLASGEETSRRYNRYSGLNEVAAFDAGKSILWRAIGHAGSDEWSLGLHNASESEWTCFQVNQADGYFFGSINGGLQRFNTFGTQLWTSPQSGARMQQLAVDQAGGLVSGIDQAGRMSLVEYESGKLHRRITLGGRDGVATALPANSAMVFGALRDGRVGIWHRGNGRSLLRLAHHGNHLSQMHYLAGQKSCVSIARDGRVWIFDCGWEADFATNEKEVIDRVWQALTMAEDVPKPYASNPVLVAALEAIPMPHDADRHAQHEALDHFQNGNWLLAWELLQGQSPQADIPVMAMVRQLLEHRRTGLMEVSEPLPSMVARLEAGTDRNLALDLDGSLWSWAYGAHTQLTAVPPDIRASRLVVAPDGNHLVVGGQQPEFELRDAGDGRRMFSLAGLETQTTGGVFSADGQTFYGMGYDPLISGWSVATGEKTWDFTLPPGSITRNLAKVDILGHSHLLLTTDRELLLFDVKQDRVERIPEQSDATDELPFPGWQVGITANGEMAVLGGTQPRLYDRRNKETKSLLDTDGKEVSLVTLMKDDSIAVAGTTDGWLYAYSLPDGEQIAKTPLPGGGSMIQLDGVDGKPWLLASSHESGVWLCSVPELKLLAHLKFDQVKTDGIRPRARYAIARDGMTVATSSTDSRIYQWDIAQAAGGTGQGEGFILDPAIDEKMDFDFDHPVTSTVKRPDEMGWIVAGIARPNRAWLAGTDAQRASQWRWESGAGTSIAGYDLLPVSDGGAERVLVATTDGRRILLDAAQGNVLSEARLGDPGTHWVGAAWDGQAGSLVTLNRGGTIQIWDVDTGEKQREIHGLGTRPVGIHLVGGRRLLVQGDEGRAEVWDMETGTRLLNMKRDAGRMIVRCSPDGNWCLAGTRSGGVEIWHVGQGVRVGSFSCMPEAVHEISFLTSGYVILTSRGGLARKLPLLHGNQSQKNQDDE